MSRQLKTLAVKVTLHNHLLFTCKTCLPVGTKTVNTFLGENWLKLWQKLFLFCFYVIGKKVPLLSKWIQEAPFGKNSYCFKCFHKTTLILVLQKGYNLFVSLHFCLPHSNCDYMQIIKSDCPDLQYDRIAVTAAILIAGYLYLSANSALLNDALEGQLLIHLWLFATQLNMQGVCFLQIQPTATEWKIISLLVPSPQFIPSSSRRIKKEDLFPSSMRLGPRTLDSINAFWWSVV